MFTKNSLVFIVKSEMSGDRKLLMMASDGVSPSETSPLLSNNGNGVQPETSPHQFDNSLVRESSSVRQSHYGRVCVLVIREGTSRIAEYVKANLPLGCDLTDLLMRVRVHKTFQDLKRRRAILPQQYSTLYPEDGKVLREENIDISLWVVLARNLTLSKDDINWNNPPKDGDDMKQHQLLRIKEVRNQLHHVPSNELNSPQFKQLWHKVEKALMALGSTQQTLDAYRTLDLDPEMTRRCTFEVKQQAMTELCNHLERESEQKKKLAKIMICMVVLFVLLFCVTIVLMTLLSEPCQQPRVSCNSSLITIPTDRGFLQIIPRAGWGSIDPVAQAPSTIDHFLGPLPYLIVTNSMGNDSCYSHDECCHVVKNLQELSRVNNKFYDIPYSFLIGGDGVVYEGRGLFYTPATALGMNGKSLSLAYIGEYELSPPTENQVRASQLLIQYLVNTGNLAPNTTVIGLCQAREKYPNRPGAALLRRMMEWKGPPNWAWRNYNLTWCDGFGMNITTTTLNYLV